MSPIPDENMLSVLSQVAPGTPMRAGLDRILESRRGGLIVIGGGDDVLSIAAGGFLVDTAFTPQRLAELSKMDGGLIVDASISRIVRANVHLLPDPKVTTTETGTRHRTAERVARSLQVPVIAVSASRGTVQVYHCEQVHPILSASRLLEKANQAVQTLQRYRSRLDYVTRHLSLLEIEDLVTVRDVVEVVQTAEMVSRISTEIKRTLIELGSDGRLIRYQLDDIMHGVADERRHLLRDYLTVGSIDLVEAMEILSQIAEDELYSDSDLAAGLKLIPADGDLDELVTPRGYRLLLQLPRINESMVSRLINRFETLPVIMRADIDELSSVDGITAEVAEALKNGTMRLVESSFLDRF